MYDKEVCFCYTGGRREGYAKDAARTNRHRFLDDYTDPEIEKRLFFGAWTDCAGLTAQMKWQVRTEVKRLTRRAGGRKLRVTWQKRW